MRAYKFRLYPNREQEKILFMNLNLCRYTYNQLLEELGRCKDKNHNHISHYIVELKKKHPILKNVYSKTLQHESDRLFSNIRGLSQAKKKGNKIGRLRFKGRDWFKTIYYNQSGFKLIKTNKRFNVLHLSKIGDIRIMQHRGIEGKIKQIIIKRKVDSWEAHIITDSVYNLQKGNRVIGIDLGVIDFLVDNEGNKVNSPLHLKQGLKKLKTLSQNLAKKKKGSKNRYKAKRLIAKHHEHITQQRDDFHHKESTKLIRSCKFIGMEDLNIKQLHHISYNARNMNDCSWGKFAQILRIKAESAGCQLVLIDPRNTTKECNNCGSLQEMPLWQRVYDCHSCHIVEDRDTNSAKVILGRALEQGSVEGNKRVINSPAKQEALSSTS